MDDDDPYPSGLKLALTEDSSWKPEEAQWQTLERAGLEMARLVKLPQSDLVAGVHLCGAEEMKSLHLQFMEDPTVTDVMSFDGEGDYLGDVVACVDVAREEGEALGHGLWPELMFYVLHGLLHNMGFDDASPEDRETMHDYQRQALDSVGVEVLQ